MFRLKFKDDTAIIKQTMRVITPVCNSPEFIRIQVKALREHLGGTPFELIVFNDAKDFADVTNFGDTGMRERITQTCNSLSLRCFNVPNDHHRYQTSPSHRHANTLRFMLAFMREFPGEYLMLDSDMWPVGPVPLAAYRAAPAGAWVLQTRGSIHYVWPNLFFVDTRRVDIRGLNFDVTPGCDTGGGSAAWLSEHKEGVVWIPHLPSCTWNAKQWPESATWHKEALLEFCEADARNREGGYWCEIYDSVFFHYRAASNWNGEGSETHLGNFREIAARLLAP